MFPHNRHGGTRLGPERNRQLQPSARKPPDFSAPGFLAPDGLPDLVYIAFCTSPLTPVRGHATPGIRRLSPTPLTNLLLLPLNLVGCWIAPKLRQDGQLVASH
jgi:hypothetical protein